MKDSWMNSGRRAGYAALFALVADASADNWCPSPTDYTISCSNCEKTLTCDRVWGPILITGTNVTLDGNGKGVYLSNGAGVYVTGAGAHIRNLAVVSPDRFGIDFHHQAYADYASVYNVGVLYALRGLENYFSRTSVSVGASGFQDNYEGVYQIAHGMYTYIDVYSSDMILNTNSGFYSLGGETQYHWDNDYSHNGVAGAQDHSNRNGGYYYNSTFNTNGSYGIYVSNQGGAEISLSYNSGVNNIMDCYGLEAVALYAENNTWRENFGCTTD